MRVINATLAFACPKWPYPQSARFYLNHTIDSQSINQHTLIIIILYGLIMFYVYIQQVLTRGNVVAVLSTCMKIESDTENCHSNELRYRREGIADALSVETKGENGADDYSASSRCTE